MTRSTPRPPAIAVIACRVLEAEIARLTVGSIQIVRREDFPIGLHDQPMVLRARLAVAVARAEADAACCRGIGWSRSKWLATPRSAARGWR